MTWLVNAALVLAGCTKKHEEPAPAPTMGSGSAAAMTGSAPAPEPVATGSAGSAVDVPTEQDFEQQAAKDITDKNVNDKLKTIENDLAH